MMKILILSLVIVNHVFQGDIVPIRSPTEMVRSFAIPHNATSTKKQTNKQTNIQKKIGKLLWNLMPIRHSRIIKYEKN